MTGLGPLETQPLILPVYGAHQNISTKEQVRPGCSSVLPVSWELPEWSHIQKISFNSWAFSTRAGQWGY